MKVKMIESMKVKMIESMKVKMRESMIVKMIESMKVKMIESVKVKMRWRESFLSCEAKTKKQMMKSDRYYQSRIRLYILYSMLSVLQFDLWISHGLETVTRWLY